MLGRPARVGDHRSLASRRVQESLWGFRGGGKSGVYRPLKVRHERNNEGSGGLQVAREGNKSS